MMQLKKKEFTAIVNKLKRGFRVKERHTGDWQINFYFKKNWVGRTKCSEGKGDIPPVIVQRIKSQLYFADDKELTDFKDCPLKCSEYIDLLKQRKKI